jgi:dipeptidyl aminopeptidase/acylaminoacyl peptidase
MNQRKTVKKSIQSEDFYRMQFIEGPQIHPDKKVVVYVLVSPEYEGERYNRTLHTIDIKTKHKNVISAGTKGGDYMPRWSPDGNSLGFMSDRSGKPQVYVMKNSWGEATPLTNAINGVQSFIWSQDGSQIAYSARTRTEERKQEDNPRKRRKPLSKIEEKRAEEDREYDEKNRMDPRIYFRTVFRQGTVFKDDRNTHIYVIHPGDRQPRRLTEGNVDYGMMCWDIDGKYIITSTNKRAKDPDIDIRSDLVKIDVNTKKIEYMTDDENGNFFPRVCPHGKWIYYLSFQNKEKHQQRMKIRRIPFSGGAPEEVLPDFDFDPHGFELDENGEWLYFIISYHGRDSIARAHVSGGTPEIIARFDGMIDNFHMLKDRIIYVAEAPDIPSDLFMIDLKKSDNINLQIKSSRKTHEAINAPFSEKNTTKIRLTNLNRKLIDRRNISTPQEVWINRPDGYSIQGWYMLPDNFKKGWKFPWIVQIHGGPHIMWGYSFWHEFQAMCGRGYGVYFSNPRGSDGYGSKFKGSIHLNWGDEDSKDILAGIDKIVEIGLADPDRLFVTGGSFGGFMTAWIVTHDSRFKAAVAQRGVYNFLSMYGASDALTLVEWEFDTLPWENSDLLWHRSPLKYVKNVTTPTMIIHSEQDFRVGISQAEEFYTALRREGKKTCLVRYPREGHELSRSGEPKHRVDRINRIIDWFDQHNMKNNQCGSQ